MNVIFLCVWTFYAKMLIGFVRRIIQLRRLLCHTAALARQVWSLSMLRPKKPMTRGKKENPKCHVPENRLKLSFRLILKSKHLPPCFFGSFNDMNVPWLSSRENVPRYALVNEPNESPHRRDTGRLRGSHCCTLRCRCQWPSGHES